jgi:hypothetical protein
MNRKAAMAEKRFPGLAVGSRGCCGNGPPGFDRHFWLGGALENLAVEQFIVKLPVEAFVVAILPGRCRASSCRRSPAISGLLSR